MFWEVSNSPQLSRLQWLLLPPVLSLAYQLVREESLLAVLSDMYEVYPLHWGRQVMTGSHVWGILANHIIMSGRRWIVGRISGSLLSVPFFLGTTNALLLLKENNFFLVFFNWIIERAFFIVKTTEEHLQSSLMVGRDYLCKTGVCDILRVQQLSSDDSS